ncbi:MAG: hypothetical protein CMJ34_06370 [Phycisphaerae bacterium]|nr:hypothetical protein [Phycisphaerae bacterium]
MHRDSEDRPGVVVASSPEAALGSDHSDGGWAATGAVSDLPAWAGQLFGDAGETSCITGGHRCVRVRDAASMTPSEFEQETRKAYRTVLDGLDADRLWRAWNFIPRINDDASEGGVDRDRYMSFNAGRHRGFSDVHGSTVRYPVASGVGHAGDDLVIHLLHGEKSPRVVDNPRQIRPDDYSDLYGDPPPAFARACLLEISGADALLVSGTASVVGEASVHDDFVAQLEETFRNLEVIVERAWPGTDLSVMDDWLIYLPEIRFSERLSDEISALVRDTDAVVEIRQQRLCRPELLVEIECAAFPGCRGSSNRAPIGDSR